VSQATVVLLVVVLVDVIALAAFASPYTGSVGINGPTSFIIFVVAGYVLHRVLNALPETLSAKNSAKLLIASLAVVFTMFLLAEAWMWSH
jgi:hypothetical protein